MPTLHKEQAELLDIVVKDKKNVFFTGCAGTGKSLVLKEIINTLESNSHNIGTIAITASTGRAAFNIGGTTLHSFAAIGLGTDSAESLATKISYNKKAAGRWKRTKLLIIDEISMIDGELFDKLEYIARHVRKNLNPFGGIQLLLSGDLLQLPPVNTESDEKKRIFEAISWNTCITTYHVLRTVMRQQDIEFIKALTCIRVGAMTEEVRNLIDKVSKPKVYDDELKPVNLYATRQKADFYNSQELDKLESEEVVFKAQDQYIMNTASARNALDNCPAPSETILKVGAQVMLVRNTTAELVNGTVGTITGFIIDKKGMSIFPVLPIVRFTLNNGKVYTRSIPSITWDVQQADGKIQAMRTQVPLILAWAVTIHKSQGQTIQRAKADVSNIFESGQLYTALSRCVDAENLEVIGFSEDKLKTDTKSIKFYVENDLL